MTAAWLKFKRSFTSNEDGDVAIMFAVMVIVLTFLAGMAIDYGRINHTNSKLLSAADAATLAAGRALLDGRYSDSEVEALALSYFQENLESSGGGFGDINNITVTVDRTSGGIEFRVDADVPMTLTRVMGYKEAHLPVASAAVFNQTDIELGMALDVTGSMNGSKLSDLKVAAKDLVDILLPDAGTPNAVRIGIAPYAAAVNAKSFAAAVSGGASIDGCVWERTGPQAYTDAAPVAGSYLAAGPPVPDIDPTEGASSYSCPKARVEPLTGDKSKLKSSIDAFTANGYTAGHLGAAWASYLVSPEWSSIWPGGSTPADYEDEETVKAVIFMTDGVFNTAYKNGTSNYQAKEICDSMKARNVVVYSVGFEAPSGAEATLKYCASSGQHYFKATNGAELRTAFATIAQQLNNLRLTN